MIISKKLMLAAGIAAFSTGGYLAIAAGPREENPRAAAPPAANGVRVTANKPVVNVMQNHDREVADWLMIGNNEEVQMAKLAAGNAEHKQVREFAMQMEKEHSVALQQLERIAGPDARANAQQPQAGAPALPAQGTGLNFLEVERQIAAQCLATATREMGEKKGPEFDRAYIGSQIGAHYRMIDTLKVLRQYASPELQKTIDQDIRTAETHLEEAKKIMHALTNDAASTSRR